ncbi:hypothetical protein PBOI14_46180 [Pseudomonas sp. Boi14]|nr:hypothetical protein PBOI14_46180 [Pseudomonas sp. Boi14]
MAQILGALGISDDNLTFYLACTPPSTASKPDPPL